MISPCGLCSREMELTFHHFIPRTLHSRLKHKYAKEQLQSGIDLCNDCHDAIHRFIPEKILAQKYTTVESLQAHEKVASFVAWVSKRPGQHKTHQPVWHRRG